MNAILERVVILIMNDLIDRSALVLKQKAHADLFAGSTVHDDIVRRDEAMMALAEIINAPSANRWISCNDKLPEKHGEYMVCFGMCDCTLNGTDVIDKRYYGEKSDGTVGWHSLCSSDITHWMPMPKPPERDV